MPVLRLKPLDGLRGVAVAGTTVFHLPGTPLEGGVAGVDMFFVLSGFLIGGILLEQAQSGRLGLIKFWAARARRLFPALIAMVVTVYVTLRVTGHVGHVADQSPWVREGTWGVLYGQNFYFIATKDDYFAPTLPSPFGHLWSLSVEEQFYLLFPLLVALAMVLARKAAPKSRLAQVSQVRWWLLVVACGLAAASLAFSLTASTPDYTPWSYYDLRARAAALLAGVALACLLTPKVKSALKEMNPTLSGAASLAALVCVLSVMVLVSSPDEYVRIGIPTTIAATFLLITCAHAPSFITRALQCSPLVGLGLISYGVYLWSVPVSSLWGEPAAQQGTPLYVVWAVCLTATVLVAAASWRLLEMPVRQSPYLNARPVLSLTSGLAAVAVTATFLHLSAPVQGSERASATSAPQLLCEDHAGQTRKIQNPRNLGCVLYDPGPSASGTVLLVGNSVMQTIQAGMIEEAKARKWRLLAVTLAGCPLGDFYAEGNEFWPTRAEVVKGDCATLERTATSLAQSGDVDAVVALDMTFPGLIASNGRVEEVHGKVVDKFGRTFAAWSDRAQLLVVLDFLPLDPPGTRDLRSPPRLDAISRTLVNTTPFVQYSKDILLAALPRDAHYLDLDPVLCPTGQPCPVEIGGVQVRKDQIHLTPDGAQLAAAAIAQKLSSALESTTVTQ